MKHALKLTIGEKQNRDSLYGFRNSRGQRFGKIESVKGRQIPPFWGNSLGQFLLFASRPEPSRAGRDDNFDLLIELTTRATKKQIEDSFLWIGNDGGKRPPVGEVFRIGDRCTVKIKTARCQMPKAEIKAAPGTVGTLPGPSGETLTVVFYSPDEKPTEPKITPKPKPTVVDPPDPPVVVAPKTGGEVLNDLLERIEKSEIRFTRAQIYTAFWNSPLRKLEPYVLDSAYWTVSQELWEEIVTISQVDKFVYTKNRRDCDDFALVLKAEASTLYGLTAIGMVVDFSGAHAFNVIFVDDGGSPRAELLEPQSDGTISAKKYPMKKGFVLF